MEIAVPDYSTGAIKWEKIASIKQLEPQHVYDLSIEGTRNFIANDIIAHNTYLATSSGNVGIGKNSPNYRLDVAGTINASGLHVDGNINVTRNIYYGGNLTGYGADYAEMFEKLNSLEKIDAGDIVAIVKGKVTKTNADAPLYMVVSELPALTGNREKGTVPVAFIGQVKTKVSGRVNEGDYILANGNGLGYAKSKRDVSFEEFKSKVVGIALEGKDNEDIAGINVAVGVK